ncbi:MAG: hypothetical protein U0I41_03590, partial [Coprococcus sp.]|nr:hypothetical protein [Coprococcus sp.]
NKYAAQQLEGQRASHTLSRVYLALTEGHWSNQSKSGLIDRPIEKVPDCFNRYQVSDAGRPSRTEYEVLSEFSQEGTPFSLVRLNFKPDEHTRSVSTWPVCPIRFLEIPFTDMPDFLDLTARLFIVSKSPVSFRDVRKPLSFPVKCRLISKNLSPIPHLSPIYNKQNSGFPPHTSENPETVFIININFRNFLNSISPTVQVR